MNEPHNLARRWKPVLLLGLGWGVATALTASEGLERAWSRRFALPPGGRVAVENVQGEVQVEGWDRAEVEVTVIKSASGLTDRLDDVRIAVERRDRMLTLRTLYPNDLAEPIRVDYRLRVPRQVYLDRLRTLEGDISVRDVEGAVDARSLHGNIKQVNVAGGVVARTLTGNIAVSLRALPASTPPMLLDTVNGNVDLSLPGRANADLELSTVAGKIEGNYIFEVGSVPGDTTRRTRVGEGGVQVRLRTVRGNIRVTEGEELL